LAGHRGQHHIDWGINSGPEFELHCGLVSEHCDTVGDRSPLSTRNCNQWSLERLVDDVDQDLTFVQYRRIEGNIGWPRVAHPDRRRINDEVSIGEIRMGTLESDNLTTVARKRRGALSSAQCAIHNDDFRRACIGQSEDDCTSRTTCS
jgi:hypothetical protein